MTALLPVHPISIFYQSRIFPVNRPLGGRKNIDKALFPTGGGYSNAMIQVFGMPIPIIALEFVESREYVIGYEIGLRFQKSVHFGIRKDAWKAAKCIELKSR